MKKKSYEQEFKSGAIKRAESPAKPKSQIAQELGIKPSLLYNWLKNNRQPSEVKAAMSHLKQQEQEKH